MDARARSLITIELRFVTDQPSEALVDRVHESVAMIVGRNELEEFRAKTMPLAPPRKETLDP